MPPLFMVEFCRLQFFVDNEWKLRYAAVLMPMVILVGVYRYSGRLEVGLCGGLNEG
jgi:hypothetical protein